MYEYVLLRGLLVYSLLTKEVLSFMSLLKEDSDVKKVFQIGHIKDTGSPDYS